MKSQRIFWTAVLLPMCLSLGACSGSPETSSDPESVGGSVSKGGKASGGSSSSSTTTTANGGSAVEKGGMANGGSVANVAGGAANGGASVGSSKPSSSTPSAAAGKGGVASGGGASKGGAASGGKATVGGTPTTPAAAGRSTVVPPPAAGTSGNGATELGGATPGGRPNAAAGRPNVVIGVSGSTGKAGAGNGGESTAAAGSTGAPPAASGEDEGADCAIGALPESGALTAIPKLPDPFKKLDGKRISTKADWRCRREEIKQLAEKFAFGTKGKPQTVTGTVSSSSISVSVSDNGKTATFSATVSLPKSGTAPYPAVIVYGGMGADTSTIQSAGAAIINYDPYSVGKETGSRSPKSGAYYNIAGSNSTTGLLVAWAWGVSRIIDVIEKSDGKTLRADGIGVTGCSRFGKGSFIAGVFDQRVALTMPVESGTAGVPIWRNVNTEGAQTLSSAYGEQPWFGDAFSAFTSSPTKAPVDTHELVAMVAPRGLFIMDNPHITNLGPKSAHAAALAGAEVYKALGAGENITYWSDIQDGSHCAVRPEWKDPMTKNIQKFLVKSGSWTGVIKASSKASSSLSDWKDWETPNLN